jgi:hypothetical protein
MKEKVLQIFLIRISKIFIVSALIFSFIALFIFYENYDSLIILPDEDNFTIVSSFLEILQIFSLVLLLTSLFLIPQLFLLLFKKLLLGKNIINNEIYYQKNLERSPPHLQAL